MHKLINLHTLEGALKELKIESSYKEGNEPNYICLNVWAMFLKDFMKCTNT